MRGCHRGMSTGPYCKSCHGEEEDLNCEYHDLWDPVLDWLGAHRACVIKRRDSTHLNKIRRTLPIWENP